MNLQVSRAQLAEIKLEILSKAIGNDSFFKLENGMFFKTFTQLEVSCKLSTGDRIWIGRMLRLANDNKPTENIDNIAIFQEPHQFKKVRRVG
jgi:hypothetical protein